MQLLIAGLQHYLHMNQYHAKMHQNVTRNNAISYEPVTSGDVATKITTCLFTFSAKKLTPLPHPILTALFFHVTTLNRKEEGGWQKLNLPLNIGGHLTMPVPFYPPNDGSDDKGEPESGTF